MERKPLTALVAAFAAFASFATAAGAATCADRAHVVEALSDRFGETLYGNAVSRDGNVLEIYSNPLNETWTVLVSLPDRGLACLVASGNGDQGLQRQLARLE